MKGSVLLLSDTRLDDPSGRAADFTTRKELLADHGWDLLVGFVPEPYVRTFLSSVWRLFLLARREEVDVVNSVNNPFHLHLIGLLVARFAGVPWVAELRDPIAENPDRDPDAIRTRLARLVEWLVVHFADSVVWSDGIQMEEDYLERTYPSVDTGTFTELPFKGFRAEEFEASSTREYEAFTLTYAGSFYEGWIEPYSFLEGLERFVSDHGCEGLRVQFFGDWADDYDAAVEAAGLESIVEHHAFVPKSELIPALKGSDVLVYIGGADPRNRLNVPSKIHDYVGAGGPILAIVDPDFRVAEIVEEHDLGVVAPPDDPGAIADAIDRLRSTDYRPDEDVYELFDRERKVEALVDVFERVS